MKGKISVFGGDKDSGMSQNEGLALYEHWEADLRPDLFNPRNNLILQGVSKRLKGNALYFAYRFDKERPRIWLKRHPFIFTSPIRNLSVVCHLVDWGPREDTNRVFDLSPYAASLLQLNTDDEVIGEPL